jgi:threonine dehydrogenase-like Zn-dependent dehydrogenase
MLGDERKATIPMPRVISWELSIRGSFGLSASAYPLLLSMIEAGRLDPGVLVQREVSLEEGAEVLMRMDSEPPTGVTVITRFDQP